MVIGMYHEDALMGDRASRAFVRGVMIDWPQISTDSYLRRIPALASLEELRFESPVTMFCGENGTGKSTLLEAIAVAYGFNPEGGTLNYRFSTYDDVSQLGSALTVVRDRARTKSSYFLRAESFFNVATKAIEYNAHYGNRDLHEQSHGESFLSFFNAFDGAGLYLMDEPEAALSPQRQLALLVRIHELAAQGAQFVIVTHSPILLGLPGARILEFGEDGLRPCDWEDTDSYRVTELFVNRRETLLRRLFE